MAKIAILGAGKIGEALVSGLLSSGWCQPEEIVATDRYEERLAAIHARYGVQTSHVNADAVEGAGIVVIAVKPQDIGTLLGEIAGSLGSDQTVLSLAAGVPTAAIERQLGHGVAVVRAMPNVAVTIREGMAGIASGRNANAEHLARAREILGRVGRTVEVDEGSLDAVTAVSGSGPAYFAFLAESMIEAAIPLGLSREVATELVVQTMFGTAKLLRDAQLDPVELREAVSSPGGTTVAALRELEQAGVRAAFLDAIQAAVRRSRELASS